MLYDSYQLQEDVTTPFRLLAGWSRAKIELFGWGLCDAVRRRSIASLTLISSLRVTHTRPNFGIDSVRVGDRDVPVTERVELTLPFGSLLHFVKADAPPQPRVLVIAPLSGHFSTLLRGTVETLLAEHDVYVTDWTNARDVPLSAGEFGIDDYVDYLIRFLDEIGPGAHILAVCQPCVQALVAVAVMSERRHPATPRSMTLMAGPIDTRESPTVVNELATEKPLSWFKRSVISLVPMRFRGRGRRVYPGFVQLFAFMGMNPERHRSAFRKLHAHLAAGEIEEANKIRSFYDEYLAVLDLTEKFYLETVERIFQKAELAEGTYRHRDRLVRADLIRNTALLTVEGGRDDICALGQTAAAHELCSSLRPHLKRHHLQANAGHYGVFSGKRWQNEIYPVVRNLILSME